MNDEQITDLAVNLVLCMMSSASTDKIRPLDWWPRAKSSMVRAADTAETWSHMISKMADKLQIDTLSNRTALSIKKLGRQLQADEAFNRFRSICRRDAIYIVAMAQAKRDEQKRDKTKKD